eukprot:COSAG01_NODE_45587_length_408_cov_0.660194_2_plen_59_part_01
MIRIASVKPILHFTSMACVLHCLISPVLIIAAPMLSAFTQHAWLEISLLVFSILSGFII